MSSGNSPTQVWGHFHCNFKRRLDALVRELQVGSTEAKVARLMLLRPLASLQSRYLRNNRHYSAPTKISRTLTVDICDVQLATQGRLSITISPNKDVAIVLQFTSEEVNLGCCRSDAATSFVYIRGVDRTDFAAISSVD